MNVTQRRRISISTQPPPMAKVLPFHGRAYPSQRDSDTDYTARIEGAERNLVKDLDRYLESGRGMRELVAALAGDYDFLDRKKFVDELCIRLERFPESRSKIGFIVSIFAIYEFTSHQDLAIACADFCLGLSPKSHGIAAASSMMLCRIADNAACSGADENARRQAVEKSVSIAARSNNGAFHNGALPMLRAISDISTFCHGIRVKASDDSQPGVLLDRLPLQEPILFLAFLAALENISSRSGDMPGPPMEFVSSCMDIARACKPELFVSSVSIAARAAGLAPKENDEYLREVLCAVRAWDQQHLDAMEITLAREYGPKRY